MTSPAQDQLQLLDDLTQGMNSGRSCEELLTLLFQRLRDFVPYHRIAIALLDEKRERLTILTTQSDGKIILGKGYSGWVRGSSLEPLIREGTTRVINDLEDYLAKKPSSDSTRLIVREGMRSSLTLPLVSQGKSIGVMFFSCRDQGSYRPEHEEFLRGIVGHMAIAVEQSRLVDALREKSEFLEEVLQNSADAIIVLDSDGQVRTWNDGARRIYGYEREEFLGRSFDLLVPPDLRVSCESEKIRDRVNAEGFVKDYETIRVAKDGRRVAINMTSTVLRNRQGRIVGRSEIHRDVTRLKKLQEEVARSQSLATIGELAATIAHEIKNPLAGISGAIQVMEDAIPATDRRRTVVAEILDQIRRLDDTVRDLLSFARPANPMRQELEARDMLTRAWTILSRQPSAANLRFRVEGDANVQGDPQLLHQVWVNLLQNAVEAMPQGGELRVSISRGDPVSIEVRDHGTGVDPAHQARLFRPFFSTKTRGTGLGLAISRKIIEAHGGTIRLASVPGQGTTVCVEIPR